MKVIDLILDYNDNKKLPEKIKVNGMIFKYDGFLTYSHQDFDKESYLFTDDYDWCAWLNVEVEIIEEDKKIEQLENYVDFANLTEDSKFDYLYEMISRLIDEVNKLKEGKDE